MLKTSEVPIHFDAFCESKEIKALLRHLNKRQRPDINLSRILGSQSKSEVLDDV